MSSLNQVERDLIQAIAATRCLLQELRRLRSFDVQQYARLALKLPADDGECTCSNASAKQNGKPRC